MSLYHRYRPQVFDDVVGNQQTVNTLQADLEKKDRPHAMLLHGPTGCGKTTLGRITASVLDSKGRDFNEIDITDLRGIDNIREIRQRSQFKPMESKCTVWLLDEVHRATPDAQSALLKILEDSPAHVYFILATTDPQKLLPTILSRCSQYEVKRLDEKQMFRLLRRVVKSEERKLDDSVYDQIVMDSMGHPRNALQILDQVLAVDEAQQLEVAKHSAEQQNKTIELCRVLIDRAHWKKVSSVLGGLKDEDPEKVRYAILGYCQVVVLNSSDESKRDVAAIIIEEFMAPLYSCGAAGLVFHCYSVTKR